MENLNATITTDTDTLEAEIADDLSYTETEVVIMTTTKTEATPKSTHNKYPFPTKAEIASQIAASFPYALTCLGIMHRRQTEHEQATKTTKDRNKRGWMSSHAVVMGRVVDKLAAGEALTAEETASVTKTLGSYTKQLAGHFRAEMVERDPELRVKAAAFFTGTEA